MVLPVVLYGNAILRTKCLPIENIDEDIKKLVEEMIKTMDAKDGIGLAAPQVGRLLRLFVLRNYEENKQGTFDLSEPKVYINPKILQVTKETCLDREGCLSIPGIKGDVERPIGLVLEAMDLNGLLFTEELMGYNARVRMHENDHLNGVLFVDRMEKGARKKIEPLLKKIR